MPTNEKNRVIFAGLVAAVALLAAILLFWDAFRSGKDAAPDPTPPAVTATAPPPAQSTGFTPAGEACGPGPVGLGWQDILKGVEAPCDYLI